MATAYKRIMGLAPAYGRKYLTEAEMRQDWEAGKDFYIPALRTYCSIRDSNLMLQQLYTHVLIGDKPNGGDFISTTIPLNHRI